MIDVARTRLAAQGLVAPHAGSPAAAVRALLAVQAQDYAAGLWAIGQRTRTATRTDVEAALADRSLVRTWPMRGTLHVVAAEDVRWLLALLAPRIIKRAASRYRGLGLDAKVFAKARTLCEKHLAGTTLTRPELFEIFKRGKIDPGEQRGIHILGALAMEGMLCLAAHRGKQPTFALLDEWIPSSRVLAGDEALGELARRYYVGHGPATVDDFAWWTGLNRTEARHATSLVAGELELHGDHYSGPRTIAKRGTVHLLSAWDELTVGYRDRSATVPASYATKTQNGLSPCVAVEGRVVGTWRRDGDRVTTDLFERADPAKAIARYAAFTASPRE